MKALKCHANLTGTFQKMPGISIPANKAWYSPVQHVLIWLKTSAKKISLRNLLATPVFDRCKCTLNISVMHEIYTEPTLLLPEFYQRNFLGKHAFRLTLYPPN